MLGYYCLALTTHEVEKPKCGKGYTDLLTDADEPVWVSNNSAFINLKQLFFLYYLELGF